MSFNSWDKLVKAQRDYPKPRFAMQVVDKALKKQPKNPYLLAWKADLALQQEQGHMLSVVSFLTDAHSQPILDTELLSYMYKNTIEAVRRLTTDVTFNSVGTKVLGAWQTTAKNMKSKRDRISLWDLLFIVAMESDCWEDARFAILHQNKEGLTDKKQAHYTLIIATQLAAEQRFIASGMVDRMAQLQQDIALKLMKQSYEASSEEAIAVKDIRDLRFMGQIYGRQYRSRELRDLWDEPRKDLEIVMDRHRPDILALMEKLYWEQRDWANLELHCQGAIDEVLSNVQLVGSSKSRFWELCAWRYDLWSGLLAALKENYNVQGTRDALSRQLRKCFPTGIDSKDRPLRLTYIKMRDELGISMLQDCQAYYQDFSSIPSCFQDLKSIVCRLSKDDLAQFQYFLYKQALEHKAEAQKGLPIDLDRYRQRGVVWLKFQYLFAASDPEASPKTYHDVFMHAINQLCVFPDEADLAFVAIYVLLKIHMLYVDTKKPVHPLEDRFNSRLLLQAAMLARHQVEKDKEKQNRSFILLASRLHLNLGLGTTAFRLYGHTKCKEMLLDTLSPYILSRISQTHPFDVKGYSGFSADEELERVIGTIERMAKKTGSYLSTDISSFKWDQAIDILSLKRKLESSLTKHICMAERRRIARLRGDPVDGLPRPNCQSLNEVSDNIDYGVFPDLEASGRPGRLLKPIMVSSLPNARWVGNNHAYRELGSRILYNESVYGDVEPIGMVVGQGPLPGPDDAMHVEKFLDTFHKDIAFLAYTISGDDNTVTEAVISARLKFMERLKISRKAFEKLRMPGNTTLAPVDEPSMCHENMLMWCYGLLEVCRVLVRFAEMVQDKVVNAKGKPHHCKALLPQKLVTELKEETNIMYNTVRDVAQSHMELVKKTGVKAIKAQVGWGYTGELLQRLLSDDEVEYYAKEYVASAQEAWSGVLKVKLR
ncbi:methionyl-tRNA synthetase [Pleosporales sp. CAS-2024a]